jgi:peroxiredoxin
MKSLNSTYEISKKKALLFVTLGITLVIINTILIYQNRELRLYLNLLQQSLELNPGAMVSTLRGVDINGNNIDINYSQDPRKTLLLIFSPDCDYCTQNMPIWKNILSNIDKNSFRVIAISLEPEGTKEYIIRHHLDSVPVITKLYLKGADTYKMGLTPETILIDSNGKVEKVWKGLIDGESRKEIEQSLGIRLSA